MTQINQNIEHSLLYTLSANRGPSPDWLTKVPTSKAEHGVPNGTIPIPGDEENSVVWLGVFHELHCANVLRKLIWFEYYSVMADLVAGRNEMRNHLGKPSQPYLPPFESI